MQVTRIDAAPEYTAPGHHGMVCRQLIGREACVSDAFWIGLSLIEPGGQIELAASPFEKAYVVIEGRVTISTEEGSVDLDEKDSCRIAPQEARALLNPGPGSATVLLVMANEH